MSTATPAAITAGLRPDLFAGVESLSRATMIVALSVLVIVGFGLRVTSLGSAGLSDDELNKLTAVQDYRAHGLTSANGEHPLVMKALLTASIIAAEKWNATRLAKDHPQLNVSVESALRFPNVLFGALTAILLFLVATELFGVEVGLISAAIWSFDPLVIGLNRIAKEDTIMIFFFLLANIFWLRGQRVAETQPQRNPDRYYWATAVCFGAMMATKLFPQMMAISVAYNYVFQAIPSTRWQIGKKRFLKFFIIAGITFAICSPTIFLAETWHAMFRFSSYQMIGHDSYEFMGRLYAHRFTDWVRGEPWYFYFVLAWTKFPVLTLAGLLAGLGLLFWRKIGDGRYFVLLWFAIWAVTFVFAGGKFTRYFLSVLPPVVMVAALGLQFIGRQLGNVLADLFHSQSIQIYARAAIVSMVIIASLWTSVYAAPHYRLYVNVLGGGPSRAGYYFPQDEFYDAYVRDAMSEIARHAPSNIRVASESQTVADFYARQAGRPDLNCVELSDPEDLATLKPGDFVIDGRGRMYFSNQAMLIRLRQASKPEFTVNVGATPAASVYRLDETSLAALLGK